jgi:hypothetical protein
MKIQICILLFVLTGFTIPDADVTLKYTFRPGDQFEYTQQSKQISKQTFPGMGDVTLEADIFGIMEMKVLSVTTSGARVEAKYSKLKMETKSSIMNMKMDSEGSQDDASNKIARAMMGKTFSFAMTSTGKVEKVEGAENLYSGLSSAGLDEDQIANSKKSLQQTLNDKSLEAILSNGFIVYADKKVKEGDTWNSQTEQTIGFPFNIDNTWSLGKVSGSTATVSSDATMSTVDKDKINALPNGMKSKMDLGGKQLVSAMVDLKTGWPTEVKVSSTLKGNMTLLAGGMIPQDMLIPMEMQIETTYTIKRK